MKVKIFLLVLTIYLGALFIDTYAFTPDSRSSVIVYGVHGLGARSAWLDRVKNYLETNDRRIKFISNDLPGFGFNNDSVNEMSPYKKGHIESYKEWVDFVDADFKILKKEYPEAKFIIFGHSMGGVIVSNMNSLNEADALVLSAPGYSGGDNFNLGFMLDTAWKYAFDRLVRKKDVYVTMPVSEKLYPSPFADDAYRTKDVTANLLIEIGKMQSASEEAVKKIELPILMIQVKNDKVLDTQKQEDFLNLMPSQNKVFKSYEGYDHEWMGNPHAEVILKDLLEFIRDIAEQP